MDLWIDMGFAVLLRILKNKTQRAAYIGAFAKLYNAIGQSFNVHHVYWDPDGVTQKLG